MPENTWDVVYYRLLPMALGLLMLDIILVFVSLLYELNTVLWYASVTGAALVVVMLLSLAYLLLTGGLKE